MLGATYIINAHPYDHTKCFNPHPAFMLGATKQLEEIYKKAHVSILTQLLCWVQRQV